MLRRFLSLACGILIAFAAAGPLCAESSRPNIVFLLADDLRPDALSALGHPVVRTPHLDRLAKQGQTFLRAYATNPVCIASRAEMLTGCTSFSNGVFPGYSHELNASRITWAEALRGAGYRTYTVGKWHLPGRPSERGFDAADALFAECHEPLPQAFARDAFDRPITGYVNWAFQTADGRPVDANEPAGLTPLVDRRIADAAIAAIEGATSAGDASRPYFLHVNFTAPHDPLFWPVDSSTERRDERRAAGIPLPRNFLPQHPFDNGGLVNRDEALLPAPRSASDVRRELAIYYALIEELDRQVGRILDALDRSGQRDDTVVVFSSDHGLAKGSHGLLGKQNFYEHTARVPLIVAGPGLANNVQRRALVQLSDLYPTLCDVAGVAVPDAVEGISFAHVLKGESDLARREIFGYFFGTQRMLCTERYKLIDYPTTGHRQLFDLVDDPDELRNLASEQAHAPTLAAHMARLQKQQEQAGDPILGGRFGVPPR